MSLIFLRLASSTICSSFLVTRYVRVKRQNQTFFVPCSPEDKIRVIKNNIASALEQGLSEKDNGVTADQMRLLLPAPKSTVLEDDKAISDYTEIENDVELHVVFQISENQWEHVAVDSTTEGGPTTAAPAATTAAN